MAELVVHQLQAIDVGIDDGAAGMLASGQPEHGLGLDKETTSVIQASQDIGQGQGAHRTFGLVAARQFVGMRHRVPRHLLPLDGDLGLERCAFQDSAERCNGQFEDRA